MIVAETVDIRSCDNLEPIDDRTITAAGATQTH